jgi:RimJ/RimL family protein N-acetyltransferase
MKLVSVYDVKEGASVLYELLQERRPETFVSHETMPTREEHDEFVASIPFRCWYLIRIRTVDAETMLVGGYAYIGAIEVTDLNEIGIAIFKRFQGHGHGRKALELFMSTHRPLPAIKAKRNARWLANVATENHGSKLFFRRMNFRPIQEVWAYGDQ